MDCIGEVRKEYGLAFNWSKLEAMPVRTCAKIQKPDGTFVESKEMITYLGAFLLADGRIGFKLGRRFGLAYQDFLKLQSVWKHSILGKKWTIQIFDACIISKLMYGLFTSYLKNSELRKLDGFQSRFLRRILRIAPSYYSRVLNKTVRQIAGQQALSTKLLEYQMKYIGKIARKVGTDVVWNTIFQPDSIELRPFGEERKRGRPRQAWALYIYRHCNNATGSYENLEYYFTNGLRVENQWENVVKKYTYSL